MPGGTGLKMTPEGTSSTFFRRTLSNLAEFAAQTSKGRKQAPGACFLPFMTAVRDGFEAPEALDGRTGPGRAQPPEVSSSASALTPAQS
ncbi:hypothetical protein ACVWXU_006565 [Streptomyces sp. TE33382]